MNKEIRIGVDTGGTFTDFVIVKKGNIEIEKIKSTPLNPSQAIMEGIKKFLAKDMSLTIVHGTTIATNTLLERKGGRTALITTKGFEDILHIGRQTRQNLYSLRGEKRIPLVPSHLCFGVDERTLSTGAVEKKINTSEIKEILDHFKSKKVEAVAVSLLHSYVNQTNENMVNSVLKNQNYFLSISSSILPEYREFERTATTAVNAYIMPVIHRYLTDLETKLHNVELRVMQSNEGYISTQKAKKEPIRTALSGPAAGVVGSHKLARSAGYKHIITFDMGGTSCDVSLINGQIRRTSESQIGHFPVRLPIIDIHTVGAGGGSIAKIDKGGSLRVGPESAGANPGPACYGLGQFPTITDANLVLGRLIPDFFLGGRMKLDVEQSHKVIHKLATKIKKSLIETAEGIIEIANSNMEKAIRVISIEKGFDTRNFSLFSFGGAGGLHAADISLNLKMPRVIVPKNAGVLSALGLLQADYTKDYSKSVLTKIKDISQKDLAREFKNLENKSRLELKEDNFKKEDMSLSYFLDLRYSGQSYEITVPYSKNHSSLSTLEDIFHQEHEKIYSYHHPQKSVEIVNIRVKAIGKSKKIRIKKFSGQGKNPAGALIRKQSVYYKGKRFEASIFNRALLKPENELKGPSIIVDFESTTFLPPLFSLKVDPYLNLIMEKV
ncbi:MAG: hydantoinase/oxoprolinase family protein [Candidatus Aminicenantaceae bacterium]